MVIVVSNFTPMPRKGYRLGVPDGVAGWKEVLNTDGLAYGGSGVGQHDAVIPAEAVRAHGRVTSLRLDLPPLATIFLVPA